MSISTKILRVVCIRTYTYEHLTYLVIVREQTVLLMRTVYVAIFVFVCATPIFFTPTRLTVTPRFLNADHDLSGSSPHSHRAFSQLQQ